MDLDLSGKVAVVTAASKGIGLGNVNALSQLPGVSALAVDLAAPEGPGRLVARAIEEHSRVDVLVNNMGGVRLRLSGFLATTDQDFEWAMQLNFFSALRATRAAVAQMLKQGGGA